MPISSELKADDLLVYLEQILTGLIDKKVQVVSYACDGMEVERSVQHLLIDKSEKIEYVIKNPRPGCEDTTITYIKYHGQVICMIQDSKHALKTFRNNLFSGARLLTLGDSIAIYDHIRELAFELDTPLYKRDVERLDRQDDNAASRLFSARVLQFLSDNHPDYIGEIVYLFVFGELVDAYQNRFISHAERLKLVLRARYFLDSWEKFLDNTGYAQSRYFLSREAVDITRIIIEGYIALVVIHRDHVFGTYPLLPWLHSSGACEHTFDEARKIVKDFTLLDFIYMVPKLGIKIRDAVLIAQGSDPKARAAGYNHTYLDHTGIDLPALMTFPTDHTIQKAADEAAQEVDSLLALLGLVPGDIYQMKANSALPSIGSWFKPPPPEESDTESESEPEPDDGLQCDTDSLSEAQELQDLMDNEENRKLSRTRKQEEQLLNLTCAALAVMTDEVMKVQYIADIDEEASEEFLAQECLDVADMLSSISLPPVNAPDEPTKPLGRGDIDFDSLDFKALVDMRYSHQTKQAANGVRTKQHQESDEDQADTKGKTVRWQLIRQFNEALKESQDDQAVGTGYERSARWHAGDGKETSSTGNSANAAAAASALTKRAATKRTRLFTKAQVPNLKEVINARVTEFKPLNRREYGIITPTTN